MNKNLRDFSLKATPQSEPAYGKTQVKNSAGGYVFEIDDLERARRFLILGSEDTYYTSGKKLTKENTDVIVRLANENHAGLLELIEEVRFKAPKPEYGIFALAIASSIGTEEERAKALALLPKIARTGTQLFQYVSFVSQMRGWGRALRRAVGDWYNEKTGDQVAYQTLKYRNREGYTHKDVLRLSHPMPVTDEHRALYKFLTSDEVNENLPRQVEGFLKAKEDQTPEEWAELVREYDLTWEMLPDAALTSAVVWEALLEKMPYRAMIRNLGRFSALGMTKAMSKTNKEIYGKIVNKEAIAKSHVHPLDLLIALRTYEQGRGVRGSLSWTPSPLITEGLEEAYYEAFGNVEKTGKRTMLALDVSGSMSFSNCAGAPITPREGSAAMAMVTLRTEGLENTEVVGFTYDPKATGGGAWWGAPEGVIPLNLRPSMSLSQVIDEISGLPFGGTDCAQPMLYAMKNEIPVDTFIIYTDSETWAGDIHPFQALKDYRQKMGIKDARLIVVGMTSNGFSIADPDDPGMLDVVGFDSSAPQIISEFSMGQI